MSLSTIAVKQTAKTALKKKYFEGVAVSALYIFAYLVCATGYTFLSSVTGPITAFFFLICYFTLLITPLTLGFVYYSVRLVFGSDTAPLLLFKYFSSGKEYERALLFSLPLTGNALYSGVLLFLPAFVVNMIYNGTVFAYVTVRKSTATEENLKYVDGYIDSDTFQWETVANVSNRELIALKNSKSIHLFVRKYDNVDGIQIPFTYIGEGKMEYIEGSKKANGAHLFRIPMKETAPEEIYYDFKLPE